MNKTKILILTAALFWGLSAATQAFAVDGRQERVREIKEDLREKAGSRPGLLQKFFNLKGRAAIGTGNVTAKDGTTLTVEKDGKSYTVLTDDKTQFRRRFWGKGSLDEIQVGHQVNVIGHWTDDARTTVQAKLVRDLSIQKRFGVFFGVVKSLTSGGWVMSTVSEKRADQTVTVSASTKFVNRKEEAIAQADVAVGHRVRVKGLWDSAANTVTEVTHVKDFNLPVRATVSATPTP
ncbi:hypothetical protein HY950_01450 [Candidatus Gottesmanbacteria bacterium]|nr:hypothetical protein [Candidatus Gottesmanbacteria bacterium]